MFGFYVWHLNFQLCDFKVDVGFKVLGVGWKFWTEVEGGVLALGLCSSSGLFECSES